MVQLNRLCSHPPLSPRQGVTLGSLVPFLGRRFDTILHSRDGWVVAHDELIKNCLKYEVFTSATIFATSLLARQYASQRRECEAAIREAFPATERKPQFRALSDLPAAVSAEPHCFLTSGTEAHRLGQLRWGLEEASFPILTVVHAVNWMDAVPNHVGLAITAQEQDTVVVTSRAAEQAFTAITNWAAEISRVPLRARVVRIPFGLDVDKVVRIDKILCRRLIGIPEDAKVILYLGRLSDEYKADLSPLLRALSTLVIEMPRLYLILAGHNQLQYASRLRLNADELRVTDHVTIIENPVEPVKNLLYGAADIFASPVDNIQESFGLALLEAMAHELPVVAADWDGYRDIVRDGVTGFLIPTYWNGLAGAAGSLLATVDVTYGVPHLLARHTLLDWEALTLRLRQLLSDREFCCRMGDAGRRAVEAQYGWKTVMKQYRDALVTAAASSSGGAARKHGPLPFNDVFAHYASAVLKDDPTVECTAAGRERLHYEGGPGGQENPMVRMLVRAANPIRVSGLVGGNEVSEVNVIIGLLKDGYLRVLDTDEVR